MAASLLDRYIRVKLTMSDRHFDSAEEVLSALLVVDKVRTCLCLVFGAVVVVEVSLLDCDGVGGVALVVFF